MIPKLKYTSKRGKTIVFDDWCEEPEYKSVWVGICPSCHRKYRGILGSRCDNVGSGACSVLGCEREASWYVDFSADEVEVFSGVEVFYTGGGVWLSAIYADSVRYYVVENVYNDCLTLYNHTREDQDTEYPCQNMVWSKGISELSAYEKEIYDQLNEKLRKEMF